MGRTLVKEISQARQLTLLYLSWWALITDSLHDHLYFLFQIDQSAQEESLPLSLRSMIVTFYSTCSSPPAKMVQTSASSICNAPMTGQEVGNYTTRPALVIMLLISSSIVHQLPVFVHAVLLACIVLRLRILRGWRISHSCGSVT